MVHKRLLRPERLAVPSQFIWLDHRLVRERHLERCSTEALALYLFLVTVADAKGLSYYTCTPRVESSVLNRSRKVADSGRLRPFPSSKKSCAFTSTRSPSRRPFDARSSVSSFTASFRSL